MIMRETVIEGIGRHRNTVRQRNLDGDDRKAERVADQTAAAEGRERWNKGKESYITKEGEWNKRKDNDTQRNQQKYTYAYSERGICWGYGNVRNERKT
jgi:hypothetical protein